MQSIDILLIEDNEGDILLTKESLEEHEIVNEILVAKDGLEAINYLLKKGQYKNCPTPDLILLDINLPKLNGQEVLKFIRSHQSIKHLPVVMLSTSSSFSDVSESHRNRANAYITKPIDADKFINEILDINGLGLSSKFKFNSEANS